MLRSARYLAFAVLLCLLIGFGFAFRGKSKEHTELPGPSVDPRALVLAPPSGETPVDREIARLQEKIRAGVDAKPWLSRLGWAFVAKARLTSDPGYYTLAEQCARLAENDPDALLLRGHVHHALHKFADAEAVARELTADPVPRWQTYALLGDALMEQGKLEEAQTAYQRMIDIRPCLQTYARVAYFRWLKGDLEGAEELMKMAVEAGNSRDPEPAAWAYTRLAFYQLCANDTEPARRSLARGLQFVPDYPAALFLRAKLELSDAQAAKAVETLQATIAQSPLPEYQWALADAARLAGDSELQAKTESALRSRGAAEDPRSFALYLATRQIDLPQATRLAHDELSARRDIFTYDALAWAALAAGRIEDASAHIERALREGTTDARLFYHAGAIAAAAGDRKDAAEWLQKASAIQHLLLPSEQAGLSQQLAALEIGAPLLSQTTTTQPPETTSGRN